MPQAMTFHTTLSHLVVFSSIPNARSETNSTPRVLIDLPGCAVSTNRNPAISFFFRKTSTHVDVAHKSSSPPQRPGPAQLSDALDPWGRACDAQLLVDVDTA